MRTFSLLVVLLFAKAAALSGHSVAWWSWTVVAYVWQDVAVALAFAAVEWSLGQRRARVVSLLYWLIVGYAAINIPIGVVLSTPLTWPMLRGAGGALADSILLYATWSNLLLIAVALLIAALLPSIPSIPSIPSRPSAPSYPSAPSILAAIVVLAGPIATSRIDTHGLHRNPLITLVTSAMPRVTGEAAAGDWTTPPFDPGPADDYSHLRGIAAGRNVILVSLESTGAQYLRLYGGADDLTPNLDRLAQSGVVFENAYAVYPESIKGLFSVLCSVFPAFDTTPATYERAPCRSVAADLANAGYRTAMFHSGRFAYLGMQSIISGRGYHTLADAGDIGGNHESSFGVDEPSTVARMLSWIDSQPAGEKFFITYLPIAGHHPYETPERGPFPRHDEIGRYRNALHYGDRALGTLIDGLRARGLEQQMLWVVIGDHGEAFGQHQGNFGHTFFLYDENVRVPFVIAAPGSIDRGGRSRTVVSLVDTAPTILDLLGLPLPDVQQGHSALAPHPRLALFFTDYSLSLVGLRDGRWKFIHDLESRRSKLFDLERDPHERADLAGAHASRVDAYARTLRAWSAAQKTILRQSLDIF